jgi:hypothetical protein
MCQLCAMYVVDLFWPTRLSVQSNQINFLCLHISRGPHAKGHDVRLLDDPVPDTECHSGMVFFSLNVAMSTRVP